MWSGLEIDEVFLGIGQGCAYEEGEKRLLFPCLSAERLPAAVTASEFSPYLGGFVVLTPPPRYCC